MRTLFGILLLISAQTVLAWGPTGHRVVGDITERHLMPLAAAKAQRLLSGQSLARVATWPDEIKSDPAQYQSTFSWHYTTWPLEAPTHTEQDETPTSGQLLKSINEQLAVLKDVNATDEKKAFSLKFLVHLLGDLHMPLHVGNGSDQGGNFCKVNFMGKPTNLHSVWDEGMIGATSLSYTEITKFILEDKTSSDFFAAKAGTIMDWAQESKNMNATIYPAEVVPSPEPTAMKAYCKKDALPEEMPKLSYEYSYKFLPVVYKRLYEAGIRLAWILNDNLK